MTLTIRASIPYNTDAFAAHSSSGQGHRPLKAEIAGSNPACATSLAAPAENLCHEPSGATPQYFSNLASWNTTLSFTIITQHMTLLVKEKGGAIYRGTDTPGEKQRCLAGGS